MQTFTQAQQAQVAAIVAQYANIRGAYAETMLQGIAHFYADSGVETDAHALYDVTLHEAAIAKLAAVDTDIEAVAVYAAELEQAL